MGNCKVPDTNHSVLAGRVVRDPELRYTSTGVPVTKVTVANGQHYKDKSTGDLVEEATFVNVVLWNKQAEYAADKLKKGSPVIVEGRLKQNNWETKGGEKRSKLEIQAFKINGLEWDDDGAPNEKKAAPSQEQQDDIPF